MMPELAVSSMPPVEPIYDTWAIKKYAGSWCIGEQFDFTHLPPSECNAWLAERVTRTEEAFRQVARIWQISLGVVDSEEQRFSRELETPAREFMSRVLQSIHEHPTAISLVEMRVDLYLFSRTQQEPETPTRVWLRLPSELRLWSGPENNDPSHCFSVDHTLFAPRSPDGHDNGQLYALNAPLVERALRRWEQLLGPIDEVEGLHGIYPYGFRAV